MKKLPLGFCLLLAACSSKKELVNNENALLKYQQPYRVYLIGKWNQQYSIFTLIDARDNFFTVRGSNNTALKKGDVYVPSN